jgi:hypothetical protein
MMTLLCIALALMCLGLFGMLIAVSRAYCDMELRAQEAESRLGVWTTTGITDARGMVWTVHAKAKPEGWYGMHES